jgi:hypothetical protein
MTRVTNYNRIKKGNFFNRRIQRKMNDIYKDEIDNVELDAEDGTFFMCYNDFRYKIINLEIFSPNYSSALISLLHILI